MRFRKSKKADLSLSINAIVVLILAITMLGLGLAFMRGMFGGTVKQFTQISDSLKKQMVDDLKASNERVSLNQVDVNVKRGEKYEVVFGIKNDDEAGVNAIQTFFIYPLCTQAIDPNANLENIELRTLEYVTIKPADVEVVKMIIQPNSQTIPTDYYCQICVIRSDSASSDVGECDRDILGESYHENKKFYIKVT